jgi:hypothetical protein
MMTFEDFLKRLGERANRYSADELRQLHIDVQRFAQILVAIHRIRQDRRSRSPQAAVDTQRHDRTLKERTLE